MSKTILIVDDDKLFRQGIASVLSAKGFTIIEADDGEAGLKQAIDKKVDMVISDVRMPKMDGLKMIDELRKDEHGKTLPAIVLSVDEQPESVNKALTAGVTVYLSKTDLNVEIIADQVAQALR